MRKLFALALYTFIACSVGAVSVVAVIANGNYRDVLVSYPIAPGLMYNAQPPLLLPTLKAIVGDASTDATALDRVTGFYEANRDSLGVMFREPNEDRLKALYGMYLVHLNSPYGPADSTNSFAAFIAAPLSQCGTRAVALSQIARAFNLESRVVGWDNGDHGWTEIKIGNRWELFDANVNVWIDHPASELVQGIERSYRTFYSPINDPHFPPDVGNQVLRVRMPGLGLYFLPAGTLVTHNEA